MHVFAERDEESFYHGERAEDVERHGGSMNALRA